MIKEVLIALKAVCQITRDWIDSCYYIGVRKSNAIRFLSRQGKGSEFHICDLVICNLLKSSIR